MIFLRDGKLPDRKYSLIKLLEVLPEQRRQFCFNIILSRSYFVDRKIRYEEVYKRKLCSSAAEMHMIRSDISYIPTPKRRIKSASKNADKIAEYSGSVTIDPFSSDSLSLEIPKSLSIPEKLPSLTPLDVDPILINVVENKLETRLSNPCLRLECLQPYCLPNFGNKQILETNTSKTRSPKVSSLIYRCWLQV